MKFVIALFVCIAAVMAADDFRNEFDKMLVATITENLQKGERHLFELQQQINDLEKTKKKEEKELIIKEIDTTVALLSGGHDLIDRELKRTDLDILEQYNFELLLKIGKKLIEDLKAAEAKVKAIVTN